MHKTDFNCSRKTHHDSRALKQTTEDSGEVIADELPIVVVDHHVEFTLSADTLQMAHRNDGDEQLLLSNALVLFGRLRLRI